jgi:hypothetical protein
LLPLATLFPHSAYICAQLQSVYRRTHQLCSLRVDLARLSATSPTATAPQFVLAAASAHSDRSLGRVHIEHVLEAALQGSSALSTAMQLATSRQEQDAAAERGMLPLGDPIALRDSHNFAAIAEAAARSAGAAGGAASLGSAPVLWLAYVRWLHSVGDTRAAWRKLTSALQRCPWSKSMGLLGLHMLASESAGLQARAVVNRMQEWETVSTSLEEVLLQLCLDGEGSLDQDT